MKFERFETPRALFYKRIDDPESTLQIEATHHGVEISGYTAITTMDQAEEIARVISWGLRQTESARTLKKWIEQKVLDAELLA